MMPARSVTGSVLALLVFGVSVEAGEKPQWRQLFNGKDLAEWKVKFKGHALG